ncbi:hypothetical protein [Gordonia rhizosphera]|uniref:hypothetical protein n=1 Tax=Gordonia rhizosphera TaxID=83341 RepID=UPI00030CF70E|nr:hypothetical protein [Gordonia rhizosphera]
MSSLANPLESAISSPVTHHPSSTHHHIAGAATRTRPQQTVERIRRSSADGGISEKLFEERVREVVAALDDISTFDPGRVRS